MITRMSHATVWVRNQQEALEFYRDKLGFEVHTDAMVGDDFRWLTMRIPSQPGFEIILMEPKPGYILDEESAAQLKALMEKGVLGGGVFEADDIHKTYEELKEVMATKRGFILAGWNGDPAVEARIKEETKATVRVMAIDEVREAPCVVTGEPGREVYFAQAY